MNNLKYEKSLTTFYSLSRREILVVVRLSKINGVSGSIYKSRDLAFW